MDVPNYGTILFPKPHVVSKLRIHIVGWIDFRTLNFINSLVLRPFVGKAAFHQTNLMSQMIPKIQAAASNSRFICRMKNFPHREFFE